MLVCVVCVGDVGLFAARVSFRVCVLWDTVGISVFGRVRPYVFSSMPSDGPGSELLAQRRRPSERA